MRQTPHSRKPGTSPPVFNGHITFDAYILLAVLFVLVIVMLLRITMHLPDTSLSDMFQTLLLLAVLMSVAVTAWRGIATADHPLPARAAAASAALGSFCCGLLAILFVEDANINLFFIFLALCASPAGQPEATSGQSEVVFSSGFPIFPGSCNRRAAGVFSDSAARHARRGNFHHVAATVRR